MGKTGHNGYLDIYGVPNTVEVNVAMVVEKHKELNVTDILLI